MATGAPPRALSERVIGLVRDCKARILEASIEEIATSGLSPIGFFRTLSERVLEDDLGMFESFMRLDDEIVARMSEGFALRIAGIVSETEAALEALGDATVQPMPKLTELLARVDYPIMAEFFCRWNGLPSPGQNEGDFSGLFCPKPFEYAEVSTAGRTFLCCPLQVPTVIGDATEGTFAEVWNSEKAQAVRRSILDGTFSHCIEKTCGPLQSRTLPRREDIVDPFLRDIIDNNRTNIDRGPTTMFMNYDRSCNLACPTCRTHLILLRGREEKASAANIQAWATADLEDARYLHITGSGDAFGSQLFHRFLQTFDPEARPNLRLSIGTNGLLLNEKTWEKICNRAIDVVVVSVDAATPETYAVNRGGDFRQLVENLRFVGRLRAENRLKVFGINFVVQQNNFREMPAFADLGASVHADGVCFQQITNWGTFTLSEFARRAVHRPEHPDHAEFLEILRHPSLARPMVDLSNLHSLRT